jgi:hypothetical protein
VNTGKADITGPAADVNLMVSQCVLLRALQLATYDVLSRTMSMFITADRNSRLFLRSSPGMLALQGYAAPGQLAAGIHTRLYARAYIIADAKDDRHVPVC